MTNPPHSSQPATAPASSSAMTPATSNDAGTTPTPTTSALPPTATLGSVHVPGLGDTTTGLPPTLSDSNAPHLGAASPGDGGASHATVLTTSSSGNASEPFVRSSTLGPISASHHHTSQLQHHLHSHLLQHHQHQLQSVGGSSGMTSHPSSSSATSSSAGHGGMVTTQHQQPQDSSHHHTSSATAPSVTDPSSPSAQVNRLHHKDSFGGPGLAFALAGNGTSGSGGGGGGGGGSSNPPPLPSGSTSLSRSASGAFSAHGGGGGGGGGGSSNVDQPPGAFNDAVEMLGTDGGDGVAQGISRSASTFASHSGSSTLLGSRGGTMGGSSRSVPIRQGSGSMSTNQGLGEGGNDAAADFSHATLGVGGRIAGGGASGREEEVGMEGYNDGEADNDNDDDAEFQEALDDTSQMGFVGGQAQQRGNFADGKPSPPPRRASMLGAPPLPPSIAVSRGESDNNYARGHGGDTSSGLPSDSGGQGQLQAGSVAAAAISPFGRAASISPPSATGTGTVMGTTAGMAATSVGNPPPLAPPRSPARERASGRGAHAEGNQPSTGSASATNQGSSTTIPLPNQSQQQQQQQQQQTSVERAVPRVKVATALSSGSNGDTSDYQGQSQQGQVYDEDVSEAAASSVTLTSVSQGRGNGGASTSTVNEGGGGGGAETFDSTVTRRHATPSTATTTTGNGPGGGSSAAGATGQPSVSVSRGTSSSHRSGGTTPSAIKSESHSRGTSGGTLKAPSGGGNTSSSRTLAPPSSRSQTVGGGGSASSRYASSSGGGGVGASASSLSLRSPGHRAALPSLPMAPNMKPAPPPAMYWSKAPVHGNAPKRSFRAHTAELSDEVLWIFGGCDQKGCFRDLWCFDTETMCWSRPKVSGDIPPPRRAHSSTMVDGRMFVFAGGDGPSYYNDLYIFDTVSLRWTKPETYGAPPSPRRAHTSNYFNGQLIIFGGGNGVGALNDVHALDIGDPHRLEWRKLECGGKMPIGRGYHTANLVDGKLIVIGGSDGHMSFNDIHILKLDTRVWYQVKTDEIHNRLGHTATQVGSYLFIIGGHDGQSYTPEILTLNLVNLQWEPRRVCGKKPPGRGYHQAWLRDSRLFIHGGFDGKDIVDELYFIDLAACAYLPQITSFGIDLIDEGEGEEEEGYRT